VGEKGGFVGKIPWWSDVSRKSKKLVEAKPEGEGVGKATSRTGKRNAENWEVGVPCCMTVLKRCYLY